MKKEVTNMSPGDLRRYSQELLIPMITTLVTDQNQRNINSMTAINRVVKYMYYDDFTSRSSSSSSLVQQTSKASINVRLCLNDVM